MSYQETLKKHLAEYKLRDLGISESGVFLYQGEERKLPHILPFGDRSHNLLKEAAPALEKYPRIKLHRYFHHLNSSQALALNLFFPYFEGGPESAAALLRALGREGVLASWEPEAIPDLVEASNIDALWTTADGTKTFCEVKLSEIGFGKAMNDERHRKKLDEVYREKLAPHLTPDQLERSSFFNGYQFYRNVWHMLADERSRLIFLLPRANSDLWNHLGQLLSGVVLPTRNRIDQVAIEDVIARLLTDEQCPLPMRQYAKKLERKYLIAASGLIE